MNVTDVEYVLIKTGAVTSYDMLVEVDGEYKWGNAHE